MENKCYKKYEEDYLKLARHINKKYYFKSYEQDIELDSIAGLSYCKALLQTEALKKFSFPTVYGIVLKSQTHIYFRGLKAKMRDGVTVSYIIDADGEEVSIYDVLYSDSDVHEEYLYNNIFAAILYKISRYPANHNIIANLVIKGYRNVDIIAITGISNETIVKVKRRIKNDISEIANG